MNNETKGKRKNGKKHQYPEETQLRHIGLRRMMTLKSFTRSASCGYWLRRSWFQASDELAGPLLGAQQGQVGGAAQAKAPPASGGSWAPEGLR